MADYYDLGARKGRLSRKRRKLVQLFVILTSLALAGCHTQNDTPSNPAANDKPGASSVVPTATDPRLSPNASLSGDREFEKYRDYIKKVSVDPAARLPEIHRIVREGKNESNRPPAKPGALSCEPPKAA
ncbi:hypothetical protein K8I61_09565 [bacterium]|nr:hypothetical protein [bacterium]